MVNLGYLMVAKYVQKLAPIEPVSFFCVQKNH